MGGWVGLWPVGRVGVWVGWSPGSPRMTPTNAQSVVTMPDGFFFLNDRSRVPLFITAQASPSPTQGNRLRGHLSRGRPGLSAKCMRSPFFAAVHDLHRTYNASVHPDVHAGRVAPEVLAPLLCGRAAAVAYDGGAMRTGVLLRPGSSVCCVPGPHTRHPRGAPGGRPDGGGCPNRNVVSCDARGVSLFDPRMKKAPGRGLGLTQSSGGWSGGRRNTLPCRGCPAP